MNIIAETDRRAQYIAGLRALADLLDQHHELDVPYTKGLNVIPAREDQRAQMAAWARALPGAARKSVRNGYFDLTGKLHGLSICVIADRDEVCEKVVTGTRDVERSVEVVPAVTETVTETEDIVEWICTPLLAGVTT